MIFFIKQLTAINEMGRIMGCSNVFEVILRYPKHIQWLLRDISLLNVTQVSVERLFSSLKFIAIGDLQRVKFSTQTLPEKIFNTRNPTRTRKIVFSNANPTRTRKKFFQLETRTNLKNIYVTILALKIFETAYNIRITIGYKDNFYQIFGINQILFKTWIKQVSIFFRKKVGF